MEVVYDDDQLEEYIEEAVRVSPDKPILVDEFLDDAVELDVDAVADGEDVLVGGVMEHVESAGVHSGDSACMIPPRSLSEETLARVREVTEDIAVALETVGLLNVQLAVKDGEVYVLEANPRSSRTVPYVSKATGVPIAKLAAKVMAGQSLADLDVREQIPEQVSVKEVVLPFDRLPGSDPRLGPEMKSTGEVMGTAETFGKAYEKAQSATGKGIPESGTAVVDLSADEFPAPDSPEGQSLREGFAEFFELVDFEDEEAFEQAAPAVRRGGARATTRKSDPTRPFVRRRRSGQSSFPSASKKPPLGPAMRSGGSLRATVTAVGGVTCSTSRPSLTTTASGASVTTILTSLSAETTSGGIPSSAHISVTTRPSTPWWTSGPPSLRL
jgi:carbamoyl-phosphate synthase large subunit